MATVLETLTVLLEGDASKYLKTLTNTQDKTSGWLGSMGKLAGGALVGGLAAAGAAVVGVGAAAVSAEGEYKSAMDAIINATGASGRQLDAMGESVLNLKGSAAGLGASMGDIGAALGEVNTRTGLTGGELEDLTGTILQFSRLTGADAVSATAALTRTMGDWGVGNEDAADLLDTLYGAGQAFGISMDSLSGKLVQFGAPLRQMGFGLEESAALFGKWEKEGVNAELAVGSLRIAAGNFAREGVDLADGLSNVQERIKGAATDSDALSIAMETFGARAGPDMAAAIREGRFELDEAIAALQGTKGNLEASAEATIGWREQWQIAMASLQTDLVPLGTALSELFEVILPYVVQGIKKVVKWITPWIDGLSALIKYFAFVVESGDTMNDWLTHLPEPIQGIVKAIGDFMTWLSDLRTRMEESKAAADGFLSKYAFVGERFSGIMESLRKITEVVLGAIQRFWEQHGEKITRVVMNLLHGVETTFRTALDVVLGMVEFWLQVLTGDFEGAGETLMSVVLTMWNGISEIFRLALDNLRTLFGDIDWSELGRNIIDGIANGISSAAGRIADAARDAARRALDAAKQWLGISSPSTVAAEDIGKPFAEGIGKGVDDAMRNTAMRIQSAMSGLVGDVSLQPAMAGPGVTNNFSIIIGPGASYEDGRRAGRGVLDELRSQGMA